MVMIVVSSLLGCAAPDPRESESPAHAQVTEAKATESNPKVTLETPVPVATQPLATATFTQPTSVVTEAISSQVANIYPLAEPGPYFVGKRKYEFEDARRSNRRVGITVWYPALLPAGSTGTVPVKDAAPDLSEAPYALILSTTKIAGIFAPYLVTQGFAWVSVNGLDTYEPWNTELIDQPLDILFALAQVSADPPHGLQGVIDVERAGATGYSFDGYNSLALAGARVDAVFYRSTCEHAAALESAPVPVLDHVCAPADHWEKFASHAGKAITASEDGLWQPLSDERIRAVVPMAGEGWWLFGEKGLAAVKRPVLLLSGSRDLYYAENVQIFNTLGTAERTLISFIDQGHMMVYDQEMIARMAHFTAAFFGYHLQGRQDLAWYFSQEFVEQHEDMAWGVYERP